MFVFREIRRSHDKKPCQKLPPHHEAHQKWKVLLFRGGFRPCFIQLCLKYALIIYFVTYFVFQEPFQNKRFLNLSNGISASLKEERSLSQKFRCFLWGLFPLEIYVNSREKFSSVFCWQFYPFIKSKHWGENLKFKQLRRKIRSLGITNRQVFVHERRYFQVNMRFVHDKQIFCTKIFQI